MLPQPELSGLSGSTWEGLADDALHRDVHLTRTLKAPLLFITHGKGVRAGVAVLEAWDPGHSPWGKEGFCTTGGTGYSYTLLDYIYH